MKNFAIPIKRVFTNSGVLSIISFLFCKGGIAQLGERLHGMQEVSGSIPLTSTNRTVFAVVWLK